MGEDQKTAITEFPAAQAVVHEKRGLSIIWIVPLVALVIGGWLVYKAFSEKGPTVTIAFKSAEGLEAGKTKIKFKDVDVGIVETIKLSDDLSHVVLTAQLVTGMEPYLTDEANFWVVRARLTAGEVSGLSTLFAGAYIAMEPGQKGRLQTDFTGLERPPVVTADLPGRHFILKAEKLGSLDIGSPVYYRQIQVGQIADYQLDDDGQYVTVKIFINDPHHHLVHKNTRFWNASGIDMTLDATGVKIDTQSVVSMMMGGIAFDTPFNFDSFAPASENDIFIMHANQAAAEKKTYQIKHYWVLNFDGSVRGLSAGAPVEFKGIPIGEVVDISSQLDIDLTGMDFKIPVLVEIEPERYLKMDELKDDEGRRRMTDAMVANGLRAQLKTGNLLTGQLYVDVDFHPEAPPQQIDWSGRYPVFPTVAQPLEEISEMVFSIISRIESIPFEQMGTDAGQMVRNLNESILLTKNLLNKFSSEVGPEALATLSQANKTLTAMEEMLSSRSPLNREATRALEELSGAARSMRVLMDYLERHPDALIYGKGAEK